MAAVKQSHGLRSVLQEAKKLWYQKCLKKVLNGTFTRKLAQQEKRTDSNKKQKNIEPLIQFIGYECN